MCRVGGRTPVWTARAALISPASPAAHLVCPSCDFTEPSAQDPGSAPDAVNSSLSTASSVLSPTTVPVPCASIRPTSSAVMPARAYARSRARRCPSGRGAVRPRERPSLAAPTALITAYTRSPSRSASASRFRTSAPTPSPSAIPSAAASKGRQRPPGDNARTEANIR